MCVLIDVTSKSGLKRRQQRRDCSMISQQMSSLILDSKMLRQAVKPKSAPPGVTFVPTYDSMHFIKSAGISAERG
jgi:hypothetical protein